MEKSIEYTHLKLPLYFLSTKHFLSKFSGNFDACACNPFQAPSLDGAWFEASCNIDTHRVRTVYRQTHTHSQLYRILRAATRQGI